LNTLFSSLLTSFTFLAHKVETADFSSSISIAFLKTILFTFHQLFALLGARARVHGSGFRESPLGLPNTGTAMKTIDNVVANNVIFFIFPPLF